MNPIAIRLLSQQLICPQFCSPEDVVRYMGAMQAQEYRMMRWAVAMRTGKPSLQAFQQAFNSGKIIRLHLMRGTWQLVAAEDYWQLLSLCASKAFKVIKGWMKSNRIYITEEEERVVREIFIMTAADKGSVTKEDFVEALANRGIKLDSHRLSYHIRLAEISGILCSGDLLPMKASYALTDNKVKNKSIFERDEALLMLTEKYFKSRQPATLEDFCWWSGLSISDCRKGIELMGEKIHQVRWKDKIFYITDNCRTRGFRKGNYLLIPPYDEYLISYKSRDIVLQHDYRHKAHNNSGIFQPIITRGGIVCGNWTPFREDFHADFFLGNHDTHIYQEWRRYQKFLTI